MNKFEKNFKELIANISDDTFFEIKSGLCFEFANTCDGFDKDIKSQKDVPQYLKELKEYVNYIEEAYESTKTILEADRTDILMLFDFNDSEYQDKINKSIMLTLENNSEIAIERVGGQIALNYSRSDNKDNTKDLDRLEAFLYE
ncbi:MAG: hypothetical protein RSD47_09005 [Romboutsia sp.]